MPTTYLLIEDFKLGLDRRRSRETGVPGSPWTLVNAHITRGGEIERMKKPVPAYTLPSGTFGMAPDRLTVRAEEHTSELQSLIRISYAVLCLKKQKPHTL